MAFIGMGLEAASLLAIKAGLSAAEFVTAGEGLSYTGQALAGLGAANLAAKGYKRIIDSNTAISDMASFQLTGSSVGKRRRVTFDDPSSYKQLASYKQRSGRKIKASARQYKLLKDLIQSVRFRYAQFTKITATQGAVFLSHKLDAASPTVVRMPVCIVNLTAVNQGGVADGTLQATPGMYFLQQVATGVASAQTFSWVGIAGFGTDGTTAKSAYQVIGPSDNLNPVIGRRGFLEWSRIRLCLWGKVKNPSTVRLSLIQFTEPEFTPEYSLNPATGSSAAVTGDARELWQHRVKPLLNGLISNQPRMTSKGVRVLKRWDVNINPIDAAAETAASDARGHMKHFDLFHRWNRHIDFTEKLAGENDETYANLIQAGDTSVPATGYTGLPRDLEKGIYFMLESITPVSTIASDDANSAVSFDINVETSWGHIQKL